MVRYQKLLWKMEALDDPVLGTRRLYVWEGGGGGGGQGKEGLKGEEETEWVGRRRSDV